MTVIGDLMFIFKVLALIVLYLVGFSILFFICMCLMPANPVKKVFKNKSNNELY